MACTSERYCSISLSRSSAMTIRLEQRGLRGVKLQWAAAMGTFRSLSADDVKTILAGFGLDDGGYRGHRAIAAGTINTNLAVDTTRGRLFLRVNEGKARADVEREAAIIAHVAARGVTTPVPLPARDGGPSFDWNGSYVSLFPFV